MGAREAARSEAMGWFGGAIAAAGAAYLLSGEDAALANLMMAFWSWLLLTPPLVGAWRRLRPAPVHAG